MNDIRNTGEKICALAPVYWDDCERAAELLRSSMENAYRGEVLLRADVSVGRTWLDAKG